SWFGASCAATASPCRPRSHTPPTTTCVPFWIRWGSRKQTLVGLSVGSEIAINFAIAYPDRVARLVLAMPGLGGYTGPPLPRVRPVFEAAGIASRAPPIPAASRRMTADRKFRSEERRGGTG